MTFKNLISKRLQTWLFFINMIRWVFKASIKCLQQQRVAYRAPLHPLPSPQAIHHAYLDNPTPSVFPSSTLRSTIQNDLLSASFRILNINITSLIQVHWKEKLATPIGSITSKSEVASQSRLPLLGWFLLIACYVSTHTFCKRRGREGEISSWSPCCDLLGNKIIRRNIKGKAQRPFCSGWSLSLILHCNPHKPKARELLNYYGDFLWAAGPSWSQDVLGNRQPGSCSVNTCHLLHTII